MSERIVNRVWIGESCDEVSLSDPGLPNFEPYILETDVRALIEPLKAALKNYAHMEAPRISGIRGVSAAEALAELEKFLEASDGK